MKSHLRWLFVLILACNAARGADEPTLKEVVQEKVQEINQAVIDADFGKVAELTHPKVVELMGGRDKMIEAMQASFKSMQARGISIKSVKVDDASDPVSAGSEQYVVVPFQLEMQAPDAKIRQKSFVIGVSNDLGKTWVFVNGGVEPKQLKQVLPSLPQQLKLPAQEKPVIEKE
jgi:hypothetical protein